MRLCLLDDSLEQIASGLACAVHVVLHKVEDESAQVLGDRVPVQRVLDVLQKGLHEVNWVQQHLQGVPHRLDVSLDVLARDLDVLHLLNDLRQGCNNGRRDAANVPAMRLRVLDDRLRQLRG